MRVPTPRAMVRLLLNFAVQKPKDMVPLVPPTIGFGRGAKIAVIDMFCHSMLPHC